MGAGIIMAQFGDVLDQVRSVLTWALPGEVQALLEGLVEEGIISEAYRKSLNLHWLNDEILPTFTSKPGCGELDEDLNFQGSTPQWDLNQEPMSQVRTGGSKSFASDHNVELNKSVSLIEELNFTRFNLEKNPSHESEILQRNQEEMQEFLEEVAMDVSSLNQEPLLSPLVYDCTLRSRDVKAELLSSASSEPASNNESISKGNLENEEVWLEQVEEAARRIAVPLWQNWERGRAMLQTLLPCMPSGCSISDRMVSEGKAQCAILNMEEEMELVTACRSLDTCVGDFMCEESSLACDTDAGRSEQEGLHLSTFNGVALFNTDDFRILRATTNASPVEACKATEAGYITEMLEDQFDVCWPADKMADTVDDLFCFTADAVCQQCGTNSGFSESTFRHLLYSGALEDSRTVLQDTSHYSPTEGLTDYLKDISRDTPAHSIDRVREFQEKTDLHCDAKMQESDQDSMGLLDFGDISELLDDEDYLVSQLDPNVLFNHDLGPDCFDESIHNSDTIMAAEDSDLANHNEPREQRKPTGKTKPDRKRRRDPLSKQRTDGNSRVKRQKVKDPPETQEATAEPTVIHGANAETVPVPAEPMRGLPTTPPGNLLVFPPQSANSIPIQFITIPDSSAYKVVQLSSSPPPLIRLPLPNTASTPTYIFVPNPSPNCKRQVPPLSPADGTVAPILMSSFHPGSMSDTANKAMSPTDAPPSPTNEISPCKESPKSPTVVEIPQTVKDYILQFKTHMSQSCQHMEADLRLTAHYVDVSVCQREIVRCGKNTNRCLDKELIITGDIDRQKSSVGQSQLFDCLNGKRYNLLLGNAGMGKTTLIKKLCLDWSKDCIPQFDFVFLLDGKQLTLAEPVHSLQTLLLSQSSFAPPCTDPEGVYTQILAAPKRVLIVFDGFDELRDYEILLQTQEKDLVASLQKDSKAQAFTVKQLFSGILQRVLLPGCTLLLATRPRGTANQLLRRADSFLEVCGFTPANVEMYVSQYFSDPELRASALDFLKSSSYLHLLCWNPGLCHLVCTVLEQCKSSKALPRTLTSLCHKVLCLKMEKDRGSTESLVEPEKMNIVEPVEKTDISNNSQGRGAQKNSRTRPKAVARTVSRNQRARRTKGQEKLDEENVCKDTKRTEDQELLSQLASLAWEGVKSNSSIVPKGRTVSSKLRAFGLRAGLLLSQSLMKRTPAKREEIERGGEEANRGMGEVEEEESKKTGGSTETSDCEDSILLWANPFLQSYMAAVHLSLSRTVTDRSFLQTLPFQTGAKGRRKPQREEMELTQRFAVGLLFHNKTELQRLHSYSEMVFRDMVASKQGLVMKHLEGLSFGDLSSAQILEACNYVYEASFMHQESGQDTDGKMLAHLAANLPELLTFRGVPLNPPDVYTVQNALRKGGAVGRSFCLDLEDSGIQLCGLRTLVGLSNINTYRACIADVVTLWEELEKRSDRDLLQGAVSKFKIHPLKATQICHIEHLEKLISIHTNKRLSDGSDQSSSILAEGVPAVKELYKLEFALGPENGPLALPKLWDLLPGLHNLQHLDVENSKIGDKGAEKLANALVSLRSLEILNLSENCIGDQGVKKLALALKDLPKLHCLSLYSNVISDEGAESLAAVLPHMASLTDLDVKYNKMTDVGAQSLGASLRNCTKVKTLRMWNQCIPYGVFERLQQQDSRILCH